MFIVVIQPFISVSTLKKTKTMFLRCTGCLNSLKNYKARFIANSSSCTTTELSKLLTPCLTAVKKHAIKLCEKVEISMRPVYLLMIFLLFTLLYLIIQLNMNLLTFFERTTNRKGSPYLACNDRNVRLLQKKT